MGGKFIEYAKLLRLPGLGGLSVTALYGGLSVGIFDYRLFLLFLMGMLSAIYGFVLNDYADVELDKLSKELAGKPLVKGAISKKTAVAISIFSLVGAYLIAFMIFFGSESGSRTMAVVVLSIAIILAAIYNLYGKKMVGSDILVGGATFLFCLFGAMAFADPTGLTWIICFLTFNQIFFMNAVEGGLKDADHDYLKGVKNIALSVGIEVKKNGEVKVPTLFKALGIAVRSCSAVLIFIPFLFFDLPLWYSWYWHIGIIALFLFLIFYLLFKMLRIQYFDRTKLRKMIAAQAFLRYSIVPVMLMGFIGWKLSLFLIFLPLIWYIVFTPLLGVKLFQPIL